MLSRAIAANSLTAVRVLLTPLVASAILNRRYILALGIFLAASATDSLDGMVARRLGAITRFGAYLDPIADKVFLSTIYICLAAVGAVPWWLVGIIFGRDILILVAAGCLMLMLNISDFAPSVWGKLSTFLQICMAVTVMTSEATAWAWIAPIREVMVRLVAVATVWSGCHYAWLAVRAVRKVRT